MSDAIGFAGLGVMGRLMAANLLAAGREVVVFNRSPGPAQELQALGARRAADLPTLARAATTIITMLADDAAVGAVAGEILDHATPGTLVIDMSTISPRLARDLHARAASKDMAFLDAPVSGGDAGARAGTLSIMVGGEPAALTRAHPIFEILGASIVHAGPAGAGQVVKACNQLLVAITIAGVSEALVLGSKLGVAPATILDVLGAGLAGNRVMEVRRTNLLDHDFTPGFKVDLHHKDLGIALDSAAQSDTSLALTAVVQQLFQALRAQGRGGEDHTALLHIIEELAGHGR
jgi:2-hydroxy-3-oxopropionate reductase